jgi:hypothetical protein
MHPSSQAFISGHFPVDKTALPPTEPEDGLQERYFLSVIHKLAAAQSVDHGPIFRNRQPRERRGACRLYLRALRAGLGSCFPVKLALIVDFDQFCGDETKVSIFGDLPFVLYEFLLAVSEPEKSILINPYDVSSFEPSVLSESILCLFRVILVPPAKES